MIPLARTIRLPVNVAAASFKVYVSHKEQTGIDVSLQQLQTAIQPFSGADLLLFASKLSVTMTNDERMPNEAYQLQIAADLLPSDLYRKYLKLQGIDHAKTSVDRSIRPIITPLHVLNFMKRVVLDHSFQGTRSIDNKTDPTSATDAFMLLRAYGDHFAYRDKSSKQFLRQVFSGLIRSSMLLHREAKERLLGRFYQLLFLLPEHVCKDKALTKSLEDIFMDSEQIKLETFFALGVLLLNKFVSASRLKTNPQDIESFERSFVINWQKDFTGLPVNLIDLMRKISAMSLAQAKNRFLHLEQEAASQNNQLSYEYGLLPLIEKPLLELTESVTILSYYPFLAEKFSVGIFWIIFDFLKKQSGKRPGDFEQYWGCLCQKYAEQVFSNDVIRLKKVKLKSYFDPSYKRAGTDARSSDIILYDTENKELFLFDVTYSALRIQTAFDEDNIQHLDDGIEKLIDKAGQLDTVIKDIKTGVLKLNNLDSNKIRKYRPYIITMGSYPIWPFTWQTVPNIWIGINERLKTKLFLQDNDISGLKIFSIAELEELGARHRAGVSIFQMLRGWAQSKRWRMEPLLNYLLDAHSKKVDYTTVKQQFRSAMDYSIHILTRQHNQNRTS